MSTLARTGFIKANILGGFCMSKIAQADFYFGAALSVLFNYKYVPALIEGGEKRRVYNITLNDGDVTLYMMYRSKPNTNNDEYKSWQFKLGQLDKDEISKMFESNPRTKLVLICGAEILRESELAILSAEQTKQCIDLNNHSDENFTIGRKKNEHSFRVSRGGGRDNALLIKADVFSEGL
jgi:hypothetical protein